MYLSIYNLIINTIFADVIITGWIELVVTTLATMCCLFAFAVPFIVVYKVICLIVGR